jgi:hypothetical protein
LISSDENNRIIIGQLIDVFGLKGRNNSKNRNKSTSTSSDNIGYVPKLPKPKIPNRYGAAMFRLTYPGGIIEESDAFLDVYVNFVKNSFRIRDH